MLRKEQSISKVSFGVFGSCALESLTEFPVVSFDVFDTLLYRRCVSPKYVFSFIERSLRIPDFAKRRVQAEEAARLKNLGLFSSPEVSIEDIYEQLSVHGRSQSELIAAEIAAEAKFLRAVPSALGLVQELLRRGRTVVATSDMYFSGKQISNFLSDCGYPTIPVFSSADHIADKRSKHQGTMFLHLSDALHVELNDIVHVGDNSVSDYLSPISLGCAALHVPNILERSFVATSENLHRLYILDQLGTFEAATLAMLQRTRLEARRELRPYREFGYVYAAPLLFGFLTWLDRTATSDRIDKLILFGRDGYIIERLAQHIAFSRDHEVLPVSRRMALVCLAARDYDAFASYFVGRAGRESVLNVARLLGGEAIASMANAYLDMGCSEVGDFLQLHRNEVIALAQEEFEAFKVAFDRAAAGSQNPAFVDVGWGLTIHKILDCLFDRKFAGLYFGRHRHAYPSEFIQCYMFDEVRGCNADAAFRFFECIELLELCFSANCSSARGYKLDANSAPEVVLENDLSYETMRGIVVQEVWQGVIEGCSDLQEYAKYLQPDGLKKAATENFLCLVETPSPAERFYLGMIPHNREIGQSSTRIADHWGKNPFRDEVAAEQHSAPPAWRRYFGRYLHLWREAGPVVATTRALRYISRSSRTIG